MKYLFNLLIALDQLVNALCNGTPDETISARCWRCREVKSFNFLRKVIDLLFFFEKDHCYNAYLAEVNRKQLAKEYTIDVPTSN